MAEDRLWHVWNATTPEQVANFAAIKLGWLHRVLISTTADQWLSSFFLLPVSALVAVGIATFLGCGHIVSHRRDGTVLPTRGSLHRLVMWERLLRLNPADLLQPLRGLQNVQDDENRRTLQALLATMAALVVWTLATVALLLLQAPVGIDVKTEAHCRHQVVSQRATNYAVGVHEGENLVSPCVKVEWELERDGNSDVESWLSVERCWAFTELKGFGDETMASGPTAPELLRNRVHKAASHPHQLLVTYVQQGRRSDFDPDVDTSRGPKKGEFKYMHDLLSVEWFKNGTSVRRRTIQFDTSVWLPAKDEQAHS